MTDLSEIASAFWRVIPADPDPGETREWLDAFESMLAAEGAERATFILRALLDQARAKGVKLPPVFNTPYCNTIPLAAQPQYPGHLEIEQRLIGLVRWNALAMVVGANSAHAELGGQVRRAAVGPDVQPRLAQRVGQHQQVVQEAAPERREDGPILGRESLDFDLAGEHDDREAGPDGLDNGPPPGHGPALLLGPGADVQHERSCGVVPGRRVQRRR